MFKRILLPLDGSAIAECALPHAVVIAKTCQTPLALVSVVDRDQLGGDDNSSSASWGLRRAELTAYLDEIAEALASRGLTVQAEVLEGDAAAEILDAAERHDADLIVLSSHGGGRASTFHLGGTVQKVSSRSPISIMLVRPTGAEDPRALEHHYERILAPVDCSHRADAGLCLAASIAEANESELLMLAVVKVPVAPRRVPGNPADQALAREIVNANMTAAKAYLNEMEQKLTGPHMKVRSVSMVSRSIPMAVHDVAERERVGLVVVTAHGSSGESGCLFGSVTRSLMHRATMPLLVLQDQPKEAFRLPSQEVASADRVIASR